MIDFFKVYYSMFLDEWEEWEKLSFIDNSAKEYSD